MNPKTRQKRLDMGVCIGCGAVLDTDGKMCSKCREKASRDSMKEYWYYQNAGICPICKKEKLFGDEKACPECRSRRANTMAQNREKNRQKINQIAKISHKKAYYSRKDAGICTRCGKKIAYNGHSFCMECLVKKKIYNQTVSAKKNGGSLILRNERPSYGKCYFCGADIDSGRICGKCKERVTNNLPNDRGGNDVWRRDNKLIGSGRNA